MRIWRLLIVAGLLLVIAAVVAWILLLPRVTQTPISANVGGVAKLGKHVRISVPAGGVDCETTVRIKRVRGLPSPTDDNMFIPSVGYEISLEDAQILKPVTLTMPYDEREIPPGRTEKDLHIAFWDGIDWQEMACDLDAEANTLVVETRHLSLWTWTTDKLFARKRHETEHFSVGYWDQPDYKHSVDPADTDPKNGIPDYIDVLGAALEAARGKVTQLGFRVPSYRISVKVHRLPEKAYGKGEIVLTPHDYLRITNDLRLDESGEKYSGGTMSDVLRYLAGHELFHISQAQYYTPQMRSLADWRGPDLWWREATAVWFGMLLGPDAGDREVLTNCINITRELTDPKWEYHNVTFASYIAHRHGPGVIREIWESYGADHSDKTCLSAIDATLQAHDSSLAATFTEYTASYALLRDWPDALRWQLTDPFAATAAFGDSKLEIEAGESGKEKPVERELSLNALSARAVKLVPKGRGTLHLAIEAADESAAPQWRGCVMVHRRGSWRRHAAIVPHQKTEDVQDVGAEVGQVAVVVASTRRRGEPQSINVTAKLTKMEWKLKPFPQTLEALRRNPRAAAIARVCSKNTYWRLEDYGKRNDVGWLLKFGRQSGPFVIMEGRHYVGAPVGWEPISQVVLRDLGDTFRFAFEWSPYEQVPVDLVKKAGITPEEWRQYIGRGEWPVDQLRREVHNW